MDGLRKPLSEMTDRELEEELTRRRRLRASSTSGRSSDSGSASGSSPNTHTQRLASLEGRRLSAPITEADRRALERLEHEMGLAAPPRRLPPAMPATRTASNERAREPAASIALSMTDEMARHYAALELKPGASFAEVQMRYRQMLERYHPDKHADDPEKHKAAIELAQELTRAYQALSETLRQRLS